MECLISGVCCSEISSVGRVGRGKEGRDQVVKFLESYAEGFGCL